MSKEKIEIQLVINGKITTGWRYEVLKCPNCELQTIFSKPNQKNGYSQFICVNPRCNFTDNFDKEDDEPQVTFESLVMESDDTELIKLCEDFDLFEWDEEP